MASKRKIQDVLGDGDDSDDRANNKPSGSSSSSSSHDAPQGIVHHPVLSLTFRRVLTLAEFLLDSLDARFSSQRGSIQALERCELERDEDSVAGLLRFVLVGMQPHQQPGNGARNGDEDDNNDNGTRRGAVERFANSGAKRKISMSEILDNVVAALVKRSPSSSHILAQNLHARIHQHHHHQSSGAGSSSNQQLALLKSYPWTELPRLLGRSAKPILTNLLLNCAVFSPGDNGALYQISGIPLPDIPTTASPSSLYPITPSRQFKESTSGSGNGNENARTPNNIIFVRRRMFYGRAALNRRGDVRLGLRHIHVLNRYPDPNDPLHTLHVLKHIFPRAFRLHNVFTSIVDRRKTTSPLVDYSLREGEIKAQIATLGEQKANKVPKRLRSALPLVARLQRLHKRCAYKELLNYYCPMPELGAQAGNVMARYETRPAAVSAFARAVLKNILPKGFLGGPDGDEAGDANREALMRYVDNFVHLRRFEKMSLHEVAQGIKVTSIPWLAFPHAHGETTTTTTTTRTVSASDLEARRGLLNELLYYVFDSLLIPLLRTNFYVTESSAHRNRVFYFRHDVWRRLSEPHLARLKTELFSEVPRDRALAILRRRTLGFNLLRLLPKTHGARPIMNLRRRPMITRRGGQDELGPSINTLMKPAFNVLDYERRRRPEVLGDAAMGGVNEIHARVKAFAQRLRKQQVPNSTSGAATGDVGRKLYFVKLDIQSCFDTIPHDKLLGLLESLFSENRYRMSRHVELRPPEGGGFNNNSNKKRKPGSQWPRREFVTRASSNADTSGLHEQSSSRIKKPRNAVLVPLGNHRFQTAPGIFNLLQEHIQNNLVRIGKKFYKQRSGIPQGSVVSSLLCNVFYGAHERECLSFLTQRKEDALLLRLVDDYLLITTDRALATRFLDAMLRPGCADEYCINVNPTKSLVNFSVTVNNHRIPRLRGGYAFPYCGTLIDTRTLAFSKDRGNITTTSTTTVGDDNDDNDDEEGDMADTAAAPADALTVETSREPGQAFFRKTVRTWKMTAASQAMFVDARHTTAPREVLRGLYAAFIDAASKMCTYIRSLRRRCPMAVAARRNSSKSSSSSSGISDAVLLRTVKAIVTCAVRSVLRVNHNHNHNHSNSNNHDDDYDGDDNRQQAVAALINEKNIRYIAAMGLLAVFARRNRQQQQQQQFEGTVRWLGSLGRATRPGTNGLAREMRRIMRPVSASPWRA